VKGTAARKREDDSYGGSLFGGQEHWKPLNMKKYEDAAGRDSSVWWTPHRALRSFFAGTSAVGYNPKAPEPT
jgi:hypothetical protein